MRQIDKQKIRIIGFFFEIGLHWQFEMGGKITDGDFKLHIYLRTNKILIHNSLYVFESWRKNLSHKKMQYKAGRKLKP
jgi:hypothetical protein